MAEALCPTTHLMIYNHHCNITWSLTNKNSHHQPLPTNCMFWWHLDNLSIMDKHQPYPTCEYHEFHPDPDHPPSNNSPRLTAHRHRRSQRAARGPHFYRAWHEVDSSEKLLARLDVAGVLVSLLVPLLVWQLLLFHFVSLCENISCADDDFVHLHGLA